MYEFAQNVWRRFNHKDCPDSFMLQMWYWSIQGDAPEFNQLSIESHVNDCCAIRLRRVEDPKTWKVEVAVVADTGQGIDSAQTFKEQVVGADRPPHCRGQNLRAARRISDLNDQMDSQIIDPQIFGLQNA
eukprot:1729741-Rhodomonas_salina.2